LVAQGLVAEVDNDLDKRQKLLHITPQGAQVAYEVFGATQHLPKILGDLDAQQGMDVLRQLDHLNHLHTQIYQQQSK
jgi:DNA-binding MarR family transcriptional regulator